MYSGWSLMASIILCLFCLGSVYAEIKDPTEPADYYAEISTASALVEVKDLNLDAVLISEGESFAIINNTLVKVGDKIGNEEVKLINASEVVLRGKGGERILRLFGKPIKEPAR